MNKKRLLSFFSLTFLLLMQSSPSFAQRFFDNFFGIVPLFGNRTGEGQWIHVACKNPEGCKGKECCYLTNDTIQVKGKLIYRELECPYSYTYYEYRDPKDNKYYCLVGYENEFSKMPYAIQSLFSVNIKTQYRFKTDSSSQKHFQIYPSLDYAFYKRFKGKQDEKNAKLLSLDFALTFNNNFKPVLESSANINLINLKSRLGFYSGIGIGRSLDGGKNDFFYFAQLGIKLCIT